MGNEIFYLSLYGVLVLATVLAQVLAALLQVGLPTLAGNREELLLTGVADRLERSVNNARRLCGHTDANHQCTHRQCRTGVFNSPSRLRGNLRFWHSISAHTDLAGWLWLHLVPVHRSPGCIA